MATASEMRPRYLEWGAGRRQDAFVAGMDGGIAALEGRHAEARARFAEARRLHTEMKTDFWLAMTDLDIVITGAMEPAERREAANEAREIFTRLRAAALLEKLDTALGTTATSPVTTAMPTREHEEIGQEA